MGPCNRLFCFSSLGPSTHVFWWYTSEGNVPLLAFLMQHFCGFCGIFVVPLNTTGFHTPGAFSQDPPDKHSTSQKATCSSKNHFQQTISCKEGTTVPVVYNGITVVILVFFVMYLSDAMFEGHRSNISSDILDLLFYFFKSCTSYQLWRHHIPNLHNTKRQYL